MVTKKDCITTDKIKESDTLLNAKFNLKADQKINQFKMENTTQKKIKIERLEALALDRVC